MKKILTIALAAMMVLSLAACGGEKPSSSESTGTPVASSSVVEDQDNSAVENDESAVVEDETGDESEEVIEGDTSEAAPSGDVEAADCPVRRCRGR